MDESVERQISDIANNAISEINRISQFPPQVPARRFHLDQNLDLLLDIHKGVY